ncbi:hypothetical protein HK104_003487, partial [Borealophlyctis nickersoniae]
MDDVVIDDIDQSLDEHMLGDKRLHQRSEDVPIALLVASCSCTLAAGSLYVFAVYATELAQTLNYNQQQLAIIASAGAWGLYITAPLFGILSDRHPSGIIMSCLCGGGLLSTGYLLMGLTLRSTIPKSEFYIVAAYFAVAGIGGAGLSAAAMTAAAQRVVASRRDMVIGLTLAAFGASGLIFANLRGLFSEGKGAEFLVMLPVVSAGLSCVAAVGFACGGSGGGQAVQDEDPLRPNETTPLLPSSDSHPSKPTNADASPSIGSSPSFLLLFMSFFTIAGGGLMYTNTVGTIARSLLPTSIAPDDAQRVQNLHVSALSFSSLIARLGVALGSNSFGRWWGQYRGGSFAVVDVEPKLAGFFVSGLIMGVGMGLVALTRTVEALMISTILIGFAHGAAFTIAPTFTASVYGTLSFGVNWGVLSLSTAMGSQAFQSMFG